MINNKKKLLNIKNKLKNHKFSIGSWLQIPSPDIAEIMSNSGYDWIAVDLEHGSISLSQFTNLCRAIELGESLPIARLSESSEKRCMEALDAGFRGIIMPNIQDSDKFNSLVSSCIYPPYGFRGVGFSRSNLYGKNINESLLKYNSPLIIAQIENVNALKDLNNICKNKKLTAIFIGPYDLSASIGLPGSFNNKEYLKVENEIINIAKKNNIPFGKHITRPLLKDLNKTISEGYQFIAYSTDAYFLNEFSSNPKKNKNQ
tara:strand:+ start:16352 stop:17128 length:777 start_codon:yes stop_codon:yes gene_type:complete